MAHQPTQACPTCDPDYPVMHCPCGGHLAGLATYDTERTTVVCSDCGAMTELVA